MMICIKESLLKQGPSCVFEVFVLNVRQASSLVHPEDSVRVHLTFSTVLKLKGHCAIERADGHLSTWTKRYLCSDSKRTVRVVRTAGVGICFCDLAKGSRI